MSIMQRCNYYSNSMNHTESGNETAVHRYEWIDDGKVVGFVEYYLFEEVCVITHTEVHAALEGKGCGSMLADKTMEHLRSHSRRIVPICGFMAHYLRKHPQHHDLVTPESRRIFRIG